MYTETPIRLIVDQESDDLSLAVEGLKGNMFYLPFTNLKCLEPELRDTFHQLLLESGTGIVRFYVTTEQGD